MFIDILTQSSINIREGLGEGYDGDIAFVSALESFGGGHNDPICVALGGMYSYFCPQDML